MNPRRVGFLIYPAMQALDLVLQFDDRDGHHWHGTLTLESVPSDAHQYVVRIATTRVG
jgi:hypothetical protein